MKLLAPKAHILDFGCGSGRDTKYFLEQGFQVTAIDGSAELCKFQFDALLENIKPENQTYRYSFLCVICKKRYIRNCGGTEPRKRVYVSWVNSCCEDEQKAYRSENYYAGKMLLKHYEQYRNDHNSTGQKRSENERVPAALVICRLVLKI